MKIQSAKVIVTCPGRNFVTLKIETDQGVYGIGDATLNGREKSVVSYLEDHVIPCLIGMDPRRIEDIWQYLYKGAYWRRGPVTMSAIAAVDTALWDLKAKAAGLPLYQLLGGASRERVMVYAHANGRDIPETVDEVLRQADLGYRAIRAQSGVPGLNKVYGVATDGNPYEPATRSLPTEQDWDTAKYLRHAPLLFEAVRNAIGWDHELLHDVHHRLTPIEAARLGKDLEPWRLFWMEDATPAENQEAFRLIRQHTTTPLAVGEVFNAIWDCKQLIEEQLIDYIRIPNQSPLFDPDWQANAHMDRAVELAVLPLRAAHDMVVVVAEHVAIESALVEELGVQVGVVGDVSDMQHPRSSSVPELERLPPVVVDLRGCGVDHRASARRRLPATNA